MDNRKFQAAAIATPPAAEASPSTGYPTDGNPGSGVPATVPGAAWFHQIGEELRAVLVAAGITPSATDLTQLLAALRSAGVFQTPALGDRTTKAATMACFSQEFGSTIASSGYQKLPSGLIIQWGSANSSASADAAVSFPIAFPTSVFIVLTTPNISGNGYMSATNTPTVNGFNLSGWTNTTTRAGINCRWVAFGY